MTSWMVVLFIDGWGFGPGHTGGSINAVANPTEVGLGALIFEYGFSAKNISFEACRCIPVCKHFGSKSHTEREL